MNAIVEMVMENMVKPQIIYAIINVREIVLNFVEG